MRDFTLSKVTRPSKLIVGVFMLLSVSLNPTMSSAKNCNADGQLSYIGRTKNDAKSVWLSKTGSGGFALDAAAGNVRVDQWDLAKPGVHLSISPFVSNGNGGTHKLYERQNNGSDCLLDTQNQKGGLVFPSLPPNFGRPPTGIMPGLPIGVTPPIGTLPPVEGMTPQVPGGVTPPIGILPPVEGVTPQVPGGVTPPIGTLPPVEGVTPQVPGGVTPPIGTQPPVEGITPERPKAPGTEKRPSTNTASVGAGKATPSGAPQCAKAYQDTTDLHQCELTNQDAELAGYQNFITPGRTYGAPSAWNFWTNYNGLTIEDNQNESRRSLDASRVTFGLDYALRPDFVLGVQADFRQEAGQAYDGVATKDGEAFVIGPYFSVLLDDHWSLSGLATYGTIQNDVKIATLRGSYRQQEFHFNITANGRYDFDKYYLQPEISFDRLNRSGETYQLNGLVEGRDLAVISDVAESTGTSILGSLEIGSVYFDGDTLISPYGQFGVAYSLANFAGVEQQVNDFNGSIRAGIRIRWSNALYLDASIGYLSLFQRDVDAMDVGLLLSSSF